MNNTEDILKRILLNMKYDPKKSLNENKSNIIKENANKCRDKYWWKMEKPDPKNKSSKFCWSGVDPLSCNLRKILTTYNLRTAFCSDIGNVMCGWVKYKNQCAFGRQGGDFKNTFIPNDNALRNETVVISPITDNESNLIVRIFVERKKLVENLKKLLGKGLITPYVELPKTDINMGYQTDYDMGKGTIVWEKEVASDQLIQSVLGLLKNQTSIPFEETEQGSQWVYINDVPKTPGIRDKITDSGFNFQKVKDEFGSTGTLEDNTKLLNAWDSGWRPGKEVSVNYQTEKYKSNKLNGVKSPNEPVDAQLDDYTVVGGGDDGSTGITLFLTGSGGN
jgi:hypothetical protein